MIYMKFRSTPLCIALFLLSLFPLQYLLSIIYNVEISKYYLLLSYITVLVYVIFNYSYTHSLTVFIGFFGIFILGHLFMDLLFNIPLRQATKWNNYLLSERTYLTVNSSYALSLIGIFFGTSYIKSIKLRINKWDTNYTIKLLKYLIIILAPLAIYKFYYDFAQIIGGGHLMLYSGLDRSPFIIRVGWYLVVLIFPILLIAVKTKKDLFYYIFAFSIINLFAFMQGSRFFFLMPILYFSWFYYKFLSQKKINIFYVIIFIVSLFSLSSLSNYYSKRSASIETDIVFSMLNLGGSYYIHAYYLEYEKQIINPSRLYIFSPIIGYIQRLYDKDITGHSIDRVEKGYSLDHKLTYAVSQKSYLAGRGLGGNYVTEFYALFGLPSVFILSLILGYFIIHMENLFLVSDSYKIISWYWISGLFFMPRSDTLAFVMGSIMTLIIFKLALFFTNTVKVVFKNGENNSLVI
jgi:oligosaccharide repeat unit polymerase